MNNINDP
jgi:hypothetical protein